MQHIALRTNDIISTVTNLKSRGQKFLTIPKTYYTQLREALKSSKVRIAEDMDVVGENQGADIKPIVGDLIFYCGQKARV